MNHISRSWQRLSENARIGMLMIVGGDPIYATNILFSEKSMFPVEGLRSKCSGRSKTKMLLVPLILSVFPLDNYFMAKEKLLQWRKNN